MREPIWAQRGPNVLTREISCWSSCWVHEPDLCRMILKSYRNMRSSGDRFISSAIWDHRRPCWRTLAFKTSSSAAVHLLLGFEPPFTGQCAERGFQVRLRSTTLPVQLPGDSGLMELDWEAGIGRKKLGVRENPKPKAENGFTPESTESSDVERLRSLNFHES